MMKYAIVITGIYLFLMVVVFPFFAPEGYVHIDKNKYGFFLLTGLLCFGLIVPAAIFLLVKQKALWKKLSLTDKTVLLYAAAVILSFLCTKWREYSWWGADGWYMGFVSQLMFAAIYFCVSRFSQKTEYWYKIFLAVSAVIFLLGLLNRFSVYPINMKSEDPGFISTLGNINWFCSYWVVTFPIGLVMYWNQKKGKNVLLILYLLLGFMIGITQGSSSGFLALGAVVLILFFLSFKEKEKLLRWLQILLLFSISMLLLSIIKGWFPQALNYVNKIEEYLTKFIVSLGVFTVIFLINTAAHFFFQKEKLEIEKLKYVPVIAAGLLCAAAIVLAICLFYYNRSSMDKNAVQEGTAAAYFTLDTDWGNGRGTTWKAGADAFAGMSFREKWTGIGPDCFYAYVYSDAEIARELYSVFGDARLTNAHNEWLTTLVNTGIFGLLSYAAIFISSIVRLLRAGKKKELLLVAAVSIVAYTVHNMVSFQQVICTPVIFIILGFGEKELREMEDLHHSVRS